MTRRPLLILPLLSGIALGALPVPAWGAPPPRIDLSPTAVAAAAHELGQSYMYLRVHDDSLVVRVEITVADLERALGFGWNPDAVTLAQAEARLGAIRAYAEPRFELSADGQPLPLRFNNMDVLYLEIANYVRLSYVIDGLEGIPDEIEVFYSVLFEADGNHRNLVMIEHNWRAGTFNNESNISLILTPRSPRQALDLTSSSVLRGFIAMIWQGIWHIWIGLDHILFLVALILPSVLVRADGAWRPVPSFRRALINIVTIVTFFTIAHSITLSLAALDYIRLPSRLVESIIAGSIAVAAWANLVPRLNIREWSIAFAFGLFHGFGFATVLGDIGLGREFLVLTLLGFNLGVELGQVVVIAAIFPILFLLRTTRLYRWIVRIGSWFLIFVALLWISERTFDFDFPLTRVLLAPISWLFGS